MDRTHSVGNDWRRRRRFNTFRRNVLILGFSFFSVPVAVVFQPDAKQPLAGVPPTPAPEAVAVHVCTRNGRGGKVYGTRGDEQTRVAVSSVRTDVASKCNDRNCR